MARPMTGRDDADHSRLWLDDGRHLAFAEGGAPDGFPVFYFHGTPSSRLEAGFADAAARRSGFRLIAPDRPGYGRSDFQQDRQLQSWPRDVLALAEHLRIGAFGIAGHSGGGPYLLACGAAIDPARLRFIAALAPWGPVASPDIMASLNRLDRAFARLANRVPGILRLGFAPMGWAARHQPKLFMGLLRHAVSAPDQEVLAQGSVARRFMAMEAEAFRQGSRGATQDACLAYRDWGFDIAANRVPIQMWLGDADLFVSRAMGDHLARAVPRMTAYWMEGAGHLCFERWDAIFARCRAEISARGAQIGGSRRPPSQEP